MLGKENQGVPCKRNMVVKLGKLISQNAKEKASSLPKHKQEGAARSTYK